MPVDQTYAVVVSPNPAPCLVVGERGHVLHWSTEAETLFGFAAPEAVGKDLHQLILPAGASPDAVPGALYGGDRNTVEALCRRKDGSLLYALVQAQPAIGVAQTAVGLTVRDNTAARARQDSQLAESRLKDLLDSMPDGIVIVNGTGHIVFANGQAALMFGYGPTELHGVPLELLVPHRLRADHSVHRARYFAEPRARAMGAGRDLLGVRKNGSEFRLEISLSGIKIDETSLVMSAVRDVSARHKADHLFEQLLESAPYAKVIVDESGTIVIVNSQIQQLFDYTREELVGQSVEKLLPERYRSKHHAHRAEFFSAARLRPMGAGLDLYARRKDGTEFPVEISLSPLDTDRGILVSAAIRDVSERKRFEQALYEKNLQLEAASRAKDRFLASMSHELRTPLNAIIGFTGTLLMKLPGPLTPDQQEQLDIVQTSARHLLSLINDLLDVAKIEADKIEVQAESTDCRQVLIEVVMTLQPAAERKGLVLVLQESRTAVLRTDRRLFRQIIINLIDNAIKYTDRGTVWVSLDGSSGGTEEITVQVRDTGRGISNEDQAKLFQPFARVHGATDLPTVGTGLGLHLSRKLAARLGGSLTCTSASGVGSVFTLRVASV